MFNREIHEPREKIRRLRRLHRSLICVISEIWGGLINEDEDCGILRRLHHIFKLPIRRDRRFKLGVHVRHGLQEAQEQAAFDRIIHILWQRPARRQRRPASSLADTMPITLPRASTSASLSALQRIDSRL